jgi:hypothetical protein
LAVLDAHLTAHGKRRPYGIDNCCMLEAIAAAGGRSGTTAIRHRRTGLRLTAQGAARLPDQLNYAGAAH